MKPNITLKLRSVCCLVRANYMRAQMVGNIQSIRSKWEIEYVAWNAKHGLDVDRSWSLRFALDHFGMRLPSAPLCSTRSPTHPEWPGVPCNASFVSVRKYRNDNAFNRQRGLGIGVHFAVRATASVVFSRFFCPFFRWIRFRFCACKAVRLQYIAVQCLNEI